MVLPPQARYPSRLAFFRFKSCLKEIVSAKHNPDLKNVRWSLFDASVQSKRGGASHELSNNGIRLFGDLKSTAKELGQEIVGKMVETAAKFIEAWRLVKQRKQKTPNEIDRGLSKLV